MVFLWFSYGKFPGKSYGIFLATKIRQATVEDDVGPGGAGLDHVDSWLWSNEFWNLTGQMMENWWHFGDFLWFIILIFIYITMDSHFRMFVQPWNPRFSPMFTIDLGGSGTCTTSTCPSEAACHWTPQSILNDVGQIRIKLWYPLVI